MVTLSLHLLLLMSRQLLVMLMAFSIYLLLISQSHHHVVRATLCSRWSVPLTRFGQSDVNYFDTDESAYCSALGMMSTSAQASSQMELLMVFWCGHRSKQMVPLMVSWYGYRCNQLVLPPGPLMVFLWASSLK